MPQLEKEVNRLLEAWMRVRQVIQAANFNRFRRAGLSATQFMTLNVVPEGGLTRAELARRLIGPDPKTAVGPRHVFIPWHS